MRFGFVTCVQLGLSCLEELISIGHRPKVLVTLQDNVARTKSGRIYLDKVAIQENIPLIKIHNINDSVAIDALQNHDLDWLFVIGWSQIARTEILNTPRRGVIGIHPTLLPEGRGRASVPWAILKGLDKTGVTMFQLDEGVDTGPLIAQLDIPLSPDETATTLYERVSRAHRTLIREGVARLNDPKFAPVPQNDSLATEWPARTPDDGEITPQMSTGEALRLVRATTHPYPGAYANANNGDVIRIWSAGAGPLSRSSTVRLKDGKIHATDFDVESRG